MVTSVDEELVFRILFLSIYAVFAGVRVYYRSQTIGRTGEKDYSQKTKALIALMLAILGYFLALGLWIVIPQSIFGFQIPLPGLMRWFGAGLAGIAIALLVWIHRTLGRQYAAKWAIQEDHQLITVGPYSRVRHPMYATFILFSLSVSLITANLLIILLAISVAIPFFWITRAEEEILLKELSEYTEYQQKVPYRLIPKIY